ncbi:MAG TPA: hypothetical protein PKM57_18935 [Kiritimatiellia bacterium]|nr:hypothetical protein [Kiritimatiellia bacterium]HPS09722.1 hypothetical protein [Kiritimatiellia bacterium]
MIQDQEKTLFAQWSRKGRIGNFAKDGVVCERLYKASVTKLLFVLKETNNTKPAFDLREFLSQGGHEPTWGNVARWIIGLRNLQTDIVWKDIEVLTPEQRTQAYSSVAAMNMKKLPGGHTTDAKLFRKTVAHDKDFIRRQIDLYDADLVILCGSVVAQGFELVYDPNIAGRWQTTSRGIPFIEFRPSKFAVSYTHPEARVQNCLLFYGLIDAVREIEQSRRR